MRRNRWIQSGSGVALAMLLALVATTGCATKKFVREEVAGSRSYTDQQVTSVRGDVDQVKGQTDAAMQKATLAERLASGDVDYTEVSSHQVNFDFDDYRLKPESQSMLDQLAGELASHRGFVLEVRGYADARGTDRYNYKLGRERADEVLRYLVTKHNVPTARVATLSFGEESPVADNSNRDGRAQNRRVQVRLLEIKESSMQPVSTLQQ